MEITLSNGVVEATVSTRGAELIDLKKEGRAILWCGDPAVWGFHAPILFPICGGLKDGKYLYAGKEYALPRHGFARFAEFKIEEQNKTRAVFLLRESAETLEQYPFPFAFRVIYTLCGTELRVDYNVKNPADGELYFSVGAHEAYACPEGIEEYSVLFDLPETLDSTPFVEGLLGHRTENYGTNVNELPLKYDWFSNDALVFLGLRSRKAWLLNRRTGERTGLDFAGHDTFLLWTKPGAKYVCLEPWCGCSDPVDSDRIFERKAGIIRLNGKEEITKTHRILL